MKKFSTKHSWYMLLGVGFAALCGCTGSDKAVMNTINQEEVMSKLSLEERHISLSVREWKAKVVTVPLLAPPVISCQEQQEPPIRSTLSAFLPLC